METIMTSDNPHIDPYLFERQFEAFRQFVEDNSGVTFVSFASNPFTEKHEGYKYRIHHAARESLAFEAWEASDIGSGEIARAVTEAIEIPESNLVPWQGRFGKEARPHHALYEASNEPEALQNIESCLFDLYHKEDHENSFDRLITIFGKSYPLVAYLYFLKDRSKYLPIAPTFFDRAFYHLGANFKTARRCSWKNYSSFIKLMNELKTMLSEKLSGEVSLLDAHSFAWMLASQLEHENKLADVRDYLKLSSTERDAIVKARIGQGRFREYLIEYWSCCAVTGCKEIPLLRASHIKPWARATLEERLSMYNGLLLSPTIDLCFDSGYVSFDDNGRLLVSESLSLDDAARLGISPEMHLLRIDPEHLKYLQYHRENIFKRT